MRAVVVGPTYPFRGGIAHYTSELVKTLASRGHAVSLVSFRRQYPAWLYPGRTDRDPSRQVLGVSAQYLLDPLNPLTWVRTAQAIGSARPHVAVLQWWTPFWAPAFAALGLYLRRRGVPVLYLVHNALPHEPHAGDGCLTRLALQFARALITFTDEDRHRLHDMLPRSTVRRVLLPACTLPTGPDVEPHQARARLGLPAGAPVVLFFGFVRPYKGLRHLLGAVAALKARGTPVRLVIAGECWEDHSSYARLIERLGLLEWVSWQNRYIPNEEVGLFFRAADVFAAPYTGTSPCAVLTLAQRFGLPAVASGELSAAAAEGGPAVRSLPELGVPSLSGAIYALAHTRPRHTPVRADSRRGWDALAGEIERLQAAECVVPLRGAQ